MDKLQEDKKEEQSNKNELEFYGPLSSKNVPLARWQGRTSSIVQVQDATDTRWYYFQLADPHNPEQLNVQSQNRSETIFFNSTSKKVLRVADDSLTWSYYTQGPFQRLESGVWLPINPTEEGSQPETFIVKGLKDESYQYDNGTGLVIKEILPEQNFGVQTDKWFEEKEVGSLDLEALRMKAKTDPEAAKKNKKVWKEAEEILEKLNKQKDMKAFREAVMKGEQHETLEIKGNYITEAFEELMTVYDCNFEYVRTSDTSSIHTILTLNGINDAKFVMGVIMPEICLYPKQLLKQVGIKAIEFCGMMMIGPRELGFSAFTNDGQIFLNCSQRNIIKIQQSIHQGIFRFLVDIDYKLPEVNDVWKSLNPPDFAYSMDRKKVPKGIKGFISFRATLNISCDMQEIYFALIKNPPTILNHSDITIAKKGHLVKNILEALYPDNINEEWWTHVTNYKDIIELSAGSTEHFKEAQFKEGELGTE